MVILFGWMIRIRRCCRPPLPLCRPRWSAMRWWVRLKTCLLLHRRSCLTARRIAKNTVHPVSCWWGWRWLALGCVSAAWGCGSCLFSARRLCFKRVSGVENANRTLTPRQRRARIAPCQSAGQARNDKQPIKENHPSGDGREAFKAAWWFWFSGHFIFAQMPTRATAPNSVATLCTSMIVKASSFMAH